MAETSGLLNRRTGYSRTEGSNPSVSASFCLACSRREARQFKGLTIDSNDKLMDKRRVAAPAPCGEVRADWCRSGADGADMHPPREGL